MARIRPEIVGDRRRLAADFGIEAFRRKNCRNASSSAGIAEHMVSAAGGMALRRHAAGGGTRSPASCRRAPTSTSTTTTYREEKDHLHRHARGARARRPRPLAPIGARHLGDRRRARARGVRDRAASASAARHRLGVGKTRTAHLPAVRQRCRRASCRTRCRPITCAGRTWRRAASRRRRRHRRPRPC